jgi:hypothetical protein
MKPASASPPWSLSGALQRSVTTPDEASGRRTHYVRAKPAITLTVRDETTTGDTLAALELQILLAKDDKITDATITSQIQRR